MIGLVLAGGKGSRMKSVDEKLLLKFKEPIILHVAQAMTKSKCFSKILFLTSPNSPKTKKLLEQKNYTILDTKGNGYVEDLNQVLKSLDDSVFVTSGDLPFLDEDIIRKIVDLYDSSNPWTTILVTKKLLGSIGISSSIDLELDNKLCSYTGISLINSRKISDLKNIEEKFVIVDDKRIGFNVNTKQDYELLCTS
ncbi:MAG: NTP transferase domain-containing protein [Nitrosopumilaceae archaeon]|nr:NTP transferase domain-containing protein [Nitrosopumilaceae archaeon]